MRTLLQLVRCFLLYGLLSPLVFGQPVPNRGSLGRADPLRKGSETKKNSAFRQDQADNAEAGTCPSWGPAIYAKNLGNKPGVVLLSEVMAPAECITLHTYWSSLNFYLGPRGGYAGIQRKIDDGGVHNNIFSVWDLQETNIPQTYAEYALPGEFVSGFGGEGTGLHTHHNMPWTPGVWYTTVVRRWYTGNGGTRIGFFMYDYNTRLWTHYVTVVIPENDAFFTSNEIVGFLEKFSGEPEERCGYWRNFWKLNQDGSWNKATQIEAGAGTGAWKAEQASSTEVKLYSCGNYSAPQSSYRFDLTIPETKPSVVIPASLSRLDPIYRNGQLTVRWELDAHTAPQLSYHIEVYTNPNLSGTPVAQVNTIRPEKRSESLTLSNLPKGTYYVRLQVTDIFEQPSNSLQAYFTTDSACGCPE